MNEGYVEPTERGQRPTKSIDETQGYGEGTPSTLSETAKLELGQRFGEYEILDVIARGGMGAVYKARQRNLNRLVALKVILTGALASEEEIQRFTTEAEAAARLSHPGIVPVYEMGTHGGRHFFSMPLMPNGTLSEKVAEAPLNDVEAAALIRDIAIAIQYAHDQGVLHRDLKPSNILMDEHQQPRIADFGLARRVDADSDLTQTGQILGTPEYMSPEQAFGSSSSIDERSDVYGLGAILYRLLVGRPPFQAPSRLDVVILVREETPVPPRQLNRKISVDLNVICMKCLEKEPEQRYTSANELADDLNACLEGRPIKAKPVGLARSTWRWYTGRRESAVLVAGGYALLTGIIFAAWNVMGFVMVPIHEVYGKTVWEAWFEIGASTISLTIPLIVIGYFTLRKNHYAIIAGLLLTLASTLFAIRMYVFPDTSTFVSNRFDGLPALLIVLGVLSFILYSIAVYATLVRRSS